MNGFQLPVTFGHTDGPKPHGERWRSRPQESSSHKSTRHVRKQRTWVHTQHDEHTEVNAGDEGQRGTEREDRRTEDKTRHR